MRISDWSSDVCSSDLVHGGLKKPGLAAAVVAFAFVLVTVHIALAQQMGNGVGQLYFAADAGQGGAQQVEYAGFEYIAAPYRSEGRRVGQVGVRTCRSRWKPYS